jgi:hypothetical protein
VTVGTHLELVAHTLQANRSAQSWHLIAYGKLAAGGAHARPTRITIHQDHSFPAQGRAKLETLAQTGWVEVATIFGGELTEKKRFAGAGVLEDFIPDLERLVRDAHAVLA